MDSHEWKSQSDKSRIANPIPSTLADEDVELDDIIMSVYSLLNFTSIMFEYSSYQFDLDMSQIKTCLYESKENIENMLQKISN